MPVEIKELHIKAVVAPEKEPLKPATHLVTDLQKLKNEIVQECMEKVFRKLQEKAER